MPLGRGQKGGIMLLKQFNLRELGSKYTLLPFVGRIRLNKRVYKR
jgi:hypothetical protein